MEAPFETALVGPVATEKKLFENDDDNDKSNDGNLLTISSPISLKAQWS